MPRLNLVVLRCTDIDAAAEFYGQLGLVFEKHAHGSGPEHYASEHAGIVFELYPASAKSPVTKSTRIGFVVDDVGACMALVEAVGGSIASLPADSPWGRRAVVRDPDGHTVELTAKARSAESR
ncbi:VOC family protein [Lacipirellula sp.]|uniref:VOC family protein n=1 Tax=Lacipirellula sp. TaxID=2691419 RepID=UPI003D0EE1C5